jgi:hypothetical protein
MIRVRGLLPAQKTITHKVTHLLCSVWRVILSNTRANSHGAAYRGGCVGRYTSRTRCDYMCIFPFPSYKAEQRSKISILHGPHSISTCGIYNTAHIRVGCRVLRDEESLCNGDLLCHLIMCGVTARANVVCNAYRTIRDTVFVSCLCVHRYSIGRLCPSAAVSSVHCRCSTHVIRHSADAPPAHRRHENIKVRGDCHTHRILTARVTVRLSVSHHSRLITSLSLSRHKLRHIFTCYIACTCYMYMIVCRVHRTRPTP